MSVEAIAWALNQPIGGTEKIVLIGIANHVGASDGGWVYMDQLARYANVDVGNVRRAVNRLIGAGLLERDVRAGGTPGRVNPRYKPNWFQIARGGAAARSDPGAAARSGAGAGAWSLIEEPSTEPSVEPPLAPAAPKRARDELFEAVCNVTDIDWHELTPTGRGPLNRAVAELRGVGATVADVFDRAVNFRLRYPEAQLTPSALTKHWAACAEQPRSLTRREVGNATALAAGRARRKELPR